MAAAAAKNGPLAPHKLSQTPLHPIESIGYDAPVKRIWVSPAMSRYKSPKHSDGTAIMTWILPHHWSVLEIDTGSSPVKPIFAWPYHHYQSIRLIIVVFPTAYAALGGHFRRRRPWWCHPVGGWPLVEVPRPYIRLGISIILFYSGLKFRRHVRMCGLKFRIFHS